MPATGTTAIGVLPAEVSISANNHYWTRGSVLGSDRAVGGSGASLKPVTSGGW
jgi:hypothetical protein